MGWGRVERGIERETKGGSFALSFRLFTQGLQALIKGRSAIGPYARRLTCNLSALMSSRQSDASTYLRMFLACIVPRAARYRLEE